MTRLALPVRSADVETSWKQVEPFIDAALARGGYRHSLDEVRTKCRDRDAQLWVGLGPSGLEAVAVTEIAAYPGAKVARVWIFSATDAPDWIANHLGAIEEWARAEGCEQLEMSGRLGWQRRLPGWSAREIIMTKELGNGQL